MQKGYFPTQKCLKMFPNTSSVCISPPVICARWYRQLRRSWLTRSVGRSVCRPSSTRLMSSFADCNALRWRMLLTMAFPTMMSASGRRRLSCVFSCSMPCFVFAEMFICVAFSGSGVMVVGVALSHLLTITNKCLSWHSGNTLFDSAWYCSLAHVASSMSNICLLYTSPSPRD